MKGFRKNKNIQPVKFLFKNIEWKYLFKEGYLKNYRTNFRDKAYWCHQNKIAELRREHNNYKKTANTWIRVVAVIFAALVALLNDFYVPFFVADSDNIFLKITSVGVSGVVMSAPIIFVIWVFRDRNRLMELENARKDTNLKEFQQLQRWATGNIEGDKDNQDNKIALQISALHSLRAYLKGEYGESFRRGAYEIFRASLATQHQKILKQVNESKFENITAEINNCQLTKQLNIIASEEWFNLLINHNFPTNNISLLGVNLSKSYLHHRTYGKTLDLKFAQLQRADLRDAELQGANLMGAQLQEVGGLRSAQLQGANLRFAELQGMNLMGAQLQGANLWSARLQGANLLSARLQGADLRFARLQGANLRFAQLQGADLWDAQLQGANLEGAQLQGANLGDAQLQGYANDNPESFYFKQRIEQQIDQDTTQIISNLPYKALSDTQKSQLIAELKAVGSVCATEAIERIKSASETLDLSEATTGKYSQQEADKWLSDYHKAMKKQ
uniref:pentapeptide repeat-containing protein n=1 Tax=Candidatus Thiodubiliella endoseptemdiera TaxID=2738886 RepID=UPI0034DE0F11